MKLIDLEPQFCKRVVKIETRSRLKPGINPLLQSFSDSDFELVTGPQEYRHPVDALADADGIGFLCPKCMAAHPDGRGVHTIICWFEDRVPDDVTPGPGRWSPRGSGYSDLSFVAAKRSNSVQLEGGCNAHFHLTNGVIVDLT